MALKLGSATEAYVIDLACKKLSCKRRFCKLRSQFIKIGNGGKYVKIIKEFILNYNFFFEDLVT